MPATKILRHPAAIFRRCLSNQMARALAVSCFLTLASGALPVHAVTWNNTTAGGANWEDTANWDGAVPLTGGSAEVNNGGTVLMNITVSNTSAYIGVSGTGGDVIAGAGAVWTIGNSGLNVGSGHPGSLKIQNGARVSSVSTTLGAGSGSQHGSALMEVDGVGSTFTQTRGTFTLGYKDGLATLNIKNGGRANASTMIIGNYNVNLNGYKIGEGIINVQGAGSILELATDSITGYDGGKGTINITDGGVIRSKVGTTSLNTNYIGNRGGFDDLERWRPSEGYANVSGAGSQWISSGGINVGIGGGKGELTISNGGAVSSPTWGIIVGQGGTPDYIDSFISSQGKLTITGAGSSYTGEYLFMIGSEGGKGDLQILDSATVNSKTASVGDNSSVVGRVATGTALVDAATWNSNYLDVGTTGGPGAIPLQNGGKIPTAYTSAVGSGRINGQQGIGTAIIEGSGTSWTAADFAIGENGGKGTVTVRDGALLKASLFYLGTPDLNHSPEAAFSNGTLNILSQAVLEAKTIYKGDGVGKVNIDGGIIRAGTNGALNQGFVTTGPGFVEGDWTIGAGGMTLDTQTYGVYFSAPLGGAGGLTKQGTGFLDLSGTHTYTGETHITAGRFILEGSIAASSLTTVDAGATIEGPGTVGDLDLHGKISPGGDKTVASMVTGDATFRGQSSMDYDVINFNGSTGTGWDFLDIDGSLNLDSSSGDPFTIRLRSIRPLNAGENFYNFGLAANFNKDQDYILTMLTATDGIVGWDEMVFALDASGFLNPDPGTWSIGKNGNSLELRYTAIPEPSALALWLLGASALGMRRRRPPEKHHSSGGQE